MYFLIAFEVALVMCAVGYKKFVWFISIGYGFAVAGIGVAMLVMFWKSLEVVTVILSLLCIVYGLRLGLYLLRRELKSKSYQNTMKTEIKDGSEMKFIAKFFIWLSCGILYVCQTSPVLFRLQNGVKTDTAAILGTVIMALGIVLESASDFTKNKFKQKNPKRFCDVGLFKIVRCPNYLGEVLIWTGVFISGVTALNGVFQWLCAICGYVAIVYIMFGGARRLEIRQNKNYGSDPEYQEYVKRVPILLPCVPLYSVEKYKWLVG